MGTQAHGSLITNRSNEERSQEQPGCKHCVLALGGFRVVADQVQLLVPVLRPGMARSQDPWVLNVHESPRISGSKHPSDTLARPTETLSTASQDSGLSTTGLGRCLRRDNGFGPVRKLHCALHGPDQGAKWGVPSQSDRYGYGFNRRHRLTPFIARAPQEHSRTRERFPSLGERHVKRAVRKGVRRHSLCA